VLCVCVCDIATCNVWLLKGGALQHALTSNSPALHVSHLMTQTQSYGSNMLCCSVFCWLVN